MSIAGERQVSARVTAQAAWRQVPGIVGLAAPMVMGLAASNLIGVTDSVMLAPLGAVPVAAVGLTGAVAMLFFAADLRGDLGPFGQDRCGLGCGRGAADLPDPPCRTGSGAADRRGRCAGHGGATAAASAARPAGRGDCRLAGILVLHLRLSHSLLGADRLQVRLRGSGEALARRRLRLPCRGDQCASELCADLGHRPVSAAGVDGGGGCLLPRRGAGFGCRVPVVALCAVDAAACACAAPSSGGKSA